MRSRLLIVTAVALLAVGACGKSKSSDVSSAGSSTTNAGQAITNNSTAGDQAGSGSTILSQENQTSTTAAGAAGGATTVKPASSGSASSTGAYKPTAPGTYTFHTTGKASSPAFGERPIDADDSQKIDPATGNDQRTTRQDANGGNTEQVIRFAADGIRLVSQKVQSQSVTKEFKPNPPVMYLPYPLKQGQEWSWSMQSTDGATTVNGKFKYDHDEDVTVGTEKLSTMVIVATVTTSGDVTSTSNETLWVSRQLSMSVQEHNVSDGRFGQVTFHSDTTRKLKSTKPA